MWPEMKENMVNACARRPQYGALTYKRNLAVSSWQRRRTLEVLREGAAGGSASLIPRKLK